MCNISTDNDSGTVGNVSLDHIVKLCYYCPMMVREVFECDKPPSQPGWPDIFDGICVEHTCTHPSVAPMLLKGIYTVPDNCPLRTTPLLLKVT